MQFANPEAIQLGDQQIEKQNGRRGNEGENGGKQQSILCKGRTQNILTIDPGLRY